MPIAKKGSGRGYSKGVQPLLISKSRYLAGLQCPKLLWYHFKPELRSIGDRIWRELQEPPWRIVYRRLDDVVQVHAVLDGRRNLEDILMERMLKS